MRLFSPRKTTLMFVIRDKTRVCTFLLVFLCHSLKWKQCWLHLLFIFEYVTLFCFFGIRLFQYGLSFFIVHLSLFCLQTPLENLEPVLREDIQKVSDLVRYLLFFFTSIDVAFQHLLLLQIWDSVPKPESHKETPLSEFFNVRCQRFYYLFDR